MSSFTDTKVNKFANENEEVLEGKEEVLEVTYSIHTYIKIN